MGPKLVLAMTQFERMGNMGRYRKKPVIVDAVQWNGGAADRKALLRELGVSGEQVTLQANGDLAIATLEGVMTAIPSDWIIKGVHHEVYPCKDHVFKATYELHDPDDLHIPHLDIR